MERPDLETVCIDGPLKGQRKKIAAGATTFRFPVRRKPSLAIIGASDQLEPLANAEYVTYQLMQLPYNSLPLTKTGGVDFDKLSFADRDLVGLLDNKAHYNIRRRSWEFWSCEPSRKGAQHGE